MTQEEKQLLLVDLCARFPYGVRLHIPSFCDTPQLLQQISDYETIEINDYEISIDEVKPYLRPMSSMTEEERNEYLSVKMQETERVAIAEVYRPEAISEIMDWFNAHHFDYRGLIPKGLAIAVTKENNPYK